MNSTFSGCYIDHEIIPQILILHINDILCEINQKIIEVRDKKCIKV